MKGRPLPWGGTGSRRREDWPPWVPPPSRTSPTRQRAGSPPPRRRGSARRAPAPRPRSASPSARSDPAAAGYGHGLQQQALETKIRGFTADILDAWAAGKAPEERPRVSPARRRPAPLGGLYAALGDGGISNLERVLEDELQALDEALDHSVERSARRERALNESTLSATHTPRSAQTLYTHKSRLSSVQRARLAPTPVSERLQRVRERLSPARSGTPSFDSDLCDQVRIADIDERPSTAYYTGASNGTGSRRPERHSEGVHSEAQHARGLMRAQLAKQAGRPLPPSGRSRDDKFAQIAQLAQDRTAGRPVTARTASPQPSPGQRASSTYAPVKSTVLDFDMPIADAPGTPSGAGSAPRTLPGDSVRDDASAPSADGVSASASSRSDDLSHLQEQYSRMQRSSQAAAPPPEGLRAWEGLLRSMTAYLDRTHALRPILDACAADSGPHSVPVIQAAQNHYATTDNAVGAAMLQALGFTGDALAAATEECLARRRYVLSHDEDTGQ